jgi:putative ABC transport system permease protein
METLLQDFRFGARMLLKNPGFTFIAVAVLALGIGANSAIFSVVNAVLFAPLPYHEPERLLKVLQTSASPGQFGMPSLWPYPRFAALRDQNEAFAGVAAYAKRAFNLTGTGEPEHLQVEFVSADYFPLLGIEATQGRTFLPEEDRTPGLHAVALLGYGLWQRRFGGDLQIVGKTIELDKHALTIVGVLPRGFKGQSGTADVWMPMMMVPTMLNPQMLTQPYSYWTEVIARLKPGLTFEQAQAEMELLHESIEKLFPAPARSRPSGSGKETFTLVPLKDANIDPMIRRSFLILLVAVAFVLLIACANTASLMLARAVARRKEFAIRFALGAKRSRIMRQMLTESLLLSIAGGTIGVLIALWGVDLLTTFRPSDNAQFWTAYARTFDFYTVRVDNTVLAFNFVISAATGILFGLIPAWQASRSGTSAVLKESASGSAVSLRNRFGARSILVVSEIALSVVLLAGAGLMLNSLLRLNSINLGFNPRGVLAMRVQSRDAKPEFYEQLLARTLSIAGVESASVASSAPLYGSSGMCPMELEGKPEQENEEPGFVNIHTISADYFKTLGIALIRGRSLTEQDRAGAVRVAIINQAAAERFWPGEDPLGRRFKLTFRADYPNAEELIEVVGIADNAKYGRVEEASGPDVYLSYLQPVETPSLLIARAAGSREALVEAVRREVQSLDNNMPVYDIKSMSERAAEVTSRTRFSALLLSLFAGLALMLSAIGIYGVTAYLVAQGAREIGIRLALGAQAGNIFRLILGQGIVLTLIGSVAGLVAAYATTRVLANQLYEVSAVDPFTFVAASLVLAGVALGASFVPARRATRVDPMIALRHE